MQRRWSRPYLRQNVLSSTEDLEMSADGASSTTRHGFQSPTLPRRQISQDTEQIFSKATELIYILMKQPKQAAERAMVDNPKKVQLEAEANSTRKQHSLYIITQNNTWSPLNISPESFDQIVNAHSLSDNIYDVVQAFRRRNCEILQFRWSACRVQLFGPGICNYVEICYRIQYPVRNNRNRGDPFSMRQIGICQKFHGPQDSTWIILQPASEVLRRLERMIDKTDYSSMQEDDPMLIHLIFLEFQSKNWDDYVEYLRVTLESLIEAAHFSRVGRSCRYPSSDYLVTFEECQDLQRFQWKLAQIVPAIDGNIVVLKTCEDRWQDNSNGTKVKASLTDVRSFIKLLEFQKESIRKLGDQAQKSADLLHKILEFRTSEQRDRDLRAMKALTSVATLYLPATLVATVFSSSLVQLLPTASPTHFVAAPQLWLPIVAILSLMALTLISIRVLERVYNYIK